MKYNEGVNGKNKVNKGGGGQPYFPGAVFMVYFV